MTKASSRTEIRSSGSIAATVALTLLLCAASADAALTPAQKCEAGKNNVAGKYAACLAKAQKFLCSTGDTIKYGLLVGKCETKLTTLWNKLELAAQTAKSTCPSTDDQSPVQEFLDACQQCVAEAVSGGTLALDPVTCAGDLGTCNSDLSSTNAELGTCNGNLGNCTSNLATCSANVSTCTAGTAAAVNVLAGKTFSSSAGLGLTGLMPDRGAVTLVPTVSHQAIAAGYHNGTGKCLGDPNLVHGNIKNGTLLFSVTGTWGGLPKTGQTKCSHVNGSAISCYGTGQDGEYLKGVEPFYIDTGNGTITDSLTDLVWEKLDKNTSNGIHDCTATYPWTNAFKRIQVLNGDETGCLGYKDPDVCCTGAGAGNCSPFAGYADWRLPNARELETLKNFGAIAPAINSFFDVNCVAGCTVTTCSCTQAAMYWSSTTDQFSTTSAWMVDFTDGSTKPLMKTNAACVRAVRGGL